MKKSLFQVCSFIIIGCGIPSQFHLNGQSSPIENEFAGKYSEYVEEGEEVVESWYHYVKTKEPSGKYILRTFIPETKQITSEARYTDESFSVLRGMANYWYENGNLKSTGNFNANNTVGEWKFYHRKSG